MAPLFFFLNCCRLLFPGHDGIIRGLVGGAGRGLSPIFLVMQEMYTWLRIRKRDGAQLGEEGGEDGIGCCQSARKCFLEAFTET